MFESNMNFHLTPACMSLQPRSAHLVWYTVNALPNVPGCAATCTVCCQLTVAMTVSQAVNANPELSSTVRESV